LPGDVESTRWDDRDRYYHRSSSHFQEAMEWLGAMKRCSQHFASSATLMAAASAKQEAGLEAGRRAYEASDYAKAIQVCRRLRPMIRKMATCNCCWRKVISNCWSMTRRSRARRRRWPIDPQNSVYHEWLGRAYEKRPIMQTCFGDINSRRRHGRIRDRRLQLDGKKFFRRGRALIEFDCSGSGIVGGGRRESVAADQAIGGDGRRRKALRGWELPGQRKTSPWRRGICESAGEQSKIGGVDLRHRGLLP